MIFLTEDGAGSITTCITISCLNTMSPTVEKHLFIEEGCRNDRKVKFCKTSSSNSTTRQMFQKDKCASSL